MARGQLILDRYEPLGTAGAGGFGTVRIAWDQRIQRKVAIKTIQLSEIDAWRAGLPGADAVSGIANGAGASTAQRWHGVQPWSDYLAENDAGWPGEVPQNGYRSEAAGEYGPDDIDEPFTALAHLPGLDEARTAAKLQDPRIVGVFDFEVRGQVAYLIMEYVEGITLTQLLARYENYLTLDVVAAVFNAVASALTVAHKAGVLHLDIKPDNILINADGQAKVTDFGLATLADASGTGLAGGGTIGYMPLEQMRREPLDVRTDEWALASMTYEMLTGDNPFRADSLANAEAAIENAELVLPSLCWDDIDEQIDDVIFYALDPERDRRYASVADFAEETAKFLGNAQTGKRQLSAIVKDALGTLGDEADDDEYEYEYDYEYGECDEAGDDASPYDEDAQKARRRPREARRARARERLASRLGSHWQPTNVIERVAVALLTGYLALSAIPGIYGLAPLAGREASPVISAVCAIGVAFVGGAFPHVGILVACLLAGFRLITLAQPVMGAVVIAAGLTWCYAYASLARQERRPALLLLIGCTCVAGIAAVVAFTALPQDLFAVPIAVAAAIVTQTVCFLVSRG